MTKLSSWLLSVVTAAAALSVLRSLMPKGAPRTAGRLAGGLAMLAVIVSPLRTLDAPTLRWEYETLAEEIEGITAEYRAENAEALESVILERTAAYISDKARALGREVEVMVSARDCGGIPCPAEVTLSIPYDGALSQFIVEEVGIVPEHQHWAQRGDGE